MTGALDSNIYFIRQRFRCNQMGGSSVNQHARFQLIRLIEPRAANTERTLRRASMPLTLPKMSDESKARTNNLTIIIPQRHIRRLFADKNREHKLAERERFCFI